MIFSTLVELGSDDVCVYVCLCVCLYVCLSENFGVDWSLQKWSDLAEILHNCSLSKYLGVFFHFFKIFIFKGMVTLFRQNEAGRLETSKMVGFG